MNREQYLDSHDGEKAFKAYYGQFVDDGVKQQVMQVIGKNKILKSTDDYFNDIPMRRWHKVFNGVLPRHIVERLRIAGDGPCVWTSVCVAKVAAMQIVEEVKCQRDG